MDFTFTQEQRMLASAFGEFADESCSPQRLRAAAEGSGDEVGRDGAMRNRAGGRVARDMGAAARWRRLVELGLPGMLAPQGHGGMGLTDIDFVLIAEEAGRTALPEPLVEHAGIAVPALTELVGGSLNAEMLDSTAAGRIRVAVGHPVNPFILDAARADYLLLTRGDEIHLVESSRTSLVHQPSIDPLRELFKVEPLLNESTRIATGQLARRVSQRVFARGALYCAAQLVGLSARMIDLAAAYARERKQFGKPIGSYQAIQHQQIGRAHV